MKHFTDDELARYAFDGDTSRHRREIESHLNECPECHANVMSIRSIDADLMDPDVWEFADRDATGRETMRGFVTAVTAEDEGAERLLETSLANPAQIPSTNLASKEVYLTAGVARRLILA